MNLHELTPFSSSEIDSDIALDCSPFLRIRKDGKVERLVGTEVTPPLDPNSLVKSKDVVYSPHLNLSSRLFLPESTSPNQKLPLLFYFHGGGFCVESPFSPFYNSYLNILVGAAKIIAVSVDYRLIPENPLPAAYDDCWTALKWAASHANGGGSEEWLTDHADFGRVFLAGDSAGGNIVYHMGRRIGQEKIDGINLTGIVLIHPFYWGNEPIGNEPKEPEKRAMIDGLWRLAHPENTAGTGSDDPWINPFKDPNWTCIGGRSVLVIVAEKDILRDRGWSFYEKLEKSGWEGKVEFMEAKGENHVFHLINPTSANAIDMLKKIVSFLNQVKA